MKSWFRRIIIGGKEIKKKAGKAEGRAVNGSENRKTFEESHKNIRIPGDLGGLEKRKRILDTCQKYIL